MRKLSMIAVVAIFALAYCGGGASDSDVKAATEGIKTAYAEVGKILEDNSGDQGIVKAEKYVDDNVDKLKGFGKTLGKISSQDQYDMVTAMQEEVQKIGSATNQKIRGNNRGAQVERLSKLLDKLGNAYVSGSKESEGMVSKAAGGAGRAATKKVTIEMAKQTADSIPEDMREQMLNQYVDAIAQQGADEAEQKEFREELKSELGW